ncbi:MAG TPA: TonB-dependent receptor, partial [Acidobacteriota bacterium]|nr:TonB-dependent receptor [Acidobacteriota bacterium]
AGRDINLNGTNTDRPHLNGDPKLDPNRSRAEVANRWFDTSVFSQPATGEFGTAGRNILDGPGFKGLDLGLSRNFRFHGQRLQFRGELFNAFNWVNLNAPNTNASAGNFGRILTAGSPRVIQLGLKLFLNSEE